MIDDLRLLIQIVKFVSHVDRKISLLHGSGRYKIVKVSNIFKREIVTLEV